MDKEIRKNILFVIPSFSGGGTERVLVNILKYIRRERFKPAVVVFNPENDYKEEIPDDVRITCFYKKRPLDFFKLVFRLSRVIRSCRPNVIASFSHYANYLVIIAAKLSGNKSPIIISERTLLDKYLSHTNFKSLKKLLIKYFYPKSSCVIAVSKEVKGDLCLHYGVLEGKCRVVYNGADIDNIRVKGEEAVKHPWYQVDIPLIAACGRFTLSKNYPLLLNSFARVLKSVNARLVILGEGERKFEIEKLSRILGIEENVFFAGFQRNPYKYIAGADIFVMSSSWEGFPNVIIEAMASGTAVISTNCPSGPNEIINDGVNGFLVPVGDKTKMAEAILRLLEDQKLRKRLADEGRRRAEDFRVEKMIAEYEDIFYQAMEGYNKK